MQTAQRHAQPGLGHPSHQADAPEIRLLGRCEVALREVTIALAQKLQMPTVGVNVTRALRRGFVNGYRQFERIQLDNAVRIRQCLVQAIPLQDLTA